MQILPQRNGCHARHVVVGHTEPGLQAGWHFNSGSQARGVIVAGFFVFSTFRVSLPGTGPIARTLSAEESVDPIDAQIVP